MIDEKLRLSGMLYFSVVDELSNQVSEIIDVVSVNHISMGYICDEIVPVRLLWYILKVNKGGSHIDVVKNVNCPTSTTGDQANEAVWMRMVGAIGTNMEHAMIEIVNEVEAVSTIKIFHEASIQGIPIHILDDQETLEAGLAGISAYPVVKNHIRAYVNAGYKATIPQRSVTVGEWSGYGWLLEDEVTGAAGYMICGGLHGETTAIMSGGNLVQAIVHWVHNFKNLLMAMVAAGGIASAGLLKVYLMIKMVELSLLLIPLAAIAGIFGVLLLLAALVAYIKLFQSFTPLSFNRRRRKRGYVYAYA